MNTVLMVLAFTISFTCLGFQEPSALVDSLLKYLNKNPRKAISIGMKALKIANKIGDPELQSKLT